MGNHSCQNREYKILLILSGKLDGTTTIFVMSWAKQQPPNPKLSSSETRKSFFPSINAMWARARSRIFFLFLDLWTYDPWHLPDVFNGVSFDLNIQWKFFTHFSPLFISGPRAPAASLIPPRAIEIAFDRMLPVF